MAKAYIDVQLGNGFFKTVDKLKAQVPEACKKATYDALKKGASALTDTKGGMPTEYNAKKKDLSQYVKVSGDAVKVRSRPFTMVHFGFTPKTYTSQKGIPIKRRKKASVTIKKGQKKSIGNAFIANPASISGGTVMLWQRKRGRDIAPVTSVSAAQMAQNEKVSEHVETEMLARFEERFSHYYDRAAKALEGKS